MCVLCMEEIAPAPSLRKSTITPGRSKDNQSQAVDLTKPLVPVQRDLLEEKALKRSGERSAAFTALPARQLGDLHEVAAGVVEPGDSRAGYLGRAAWRDRCCVFDGDS